MEYLENSKHYTGSELDRTFFMPLLYGETAQEIGVKILYNMPVPTSVAVTRSKQNILQKLDKKGWSSIQDIHATNVEIPMFRVKAENAYSAADYFSTIYEHLLLDAKVNMEDLAGTELETVETEMFRQTVAENIRITMWLGDSTASDGYNTFDGFLKQIMEGVEEDFVSNGTYKDTDLQDPAYVTTIFDKLLGDSMPGIKSEKDKSKLVYFVTSDLYEMYVKYLDNKGVEPAYMEEINGRKRLCYHGIPVFDMNINHYGYKNTIPKSFGFLTMRDNLVLALNTSDMPGAEVRMWYNPDEMENRQRAVFLAGCKVLDLSYVSFMKKDPAM